MTIERDSAWVNLPNRVALHYRLYSQDIEHLPALILMHPPLLSVDFFSSYFENLWLRENFTLVAFDARGHGKTCSPLTDTRDCCTDAADLAFAQAKLGLKPAHIFAVGPIPMMVAFTFAILFPNNCASLALSWVNDPCEIEAAVKPVEGLITAWPSTKNYEECEALCQEASIFFAPNDTLLDQDFRDEFISHLQQRYPCTKAEEMVDNMLLLCRRRVFGDELGLIKQPTLILQADSIFYTADMAERLRKKLTGIPGGAELIHLPEDTPCVDAAAIVPGFQDEIILSLTFFLERELCKPELVSESWLTPPPTALSRVSMAFNVPRPSLSNPFSQESFSVVTRQRKQFWNSINRLTREHQSHAFYPLDEHGKPLRKFSERRAFLPPRASPRSLGSGSLVSLRTSRSVSIHSLDTGETTYLEDIEVASSYHCTTATSTTTSTSTSAGEASVDYCSSLRHPRSLAALELDRD